MLGDSVIYPGHPITLAYLIVKNFENWESASKASFTKYGDYIAPAAVCSMEIPGAGGNVGCALTFLHILKQGQVEKAFEYAEYAWDGYTEGVFEERRVFGQAQADEVKDKLLESLRDWF